MLVPALGCPSNFSPFLRLSAQHSMTLASAHMSKSHKQVPLVTRPPPPLSSPVLLLLFLIYLITIPQASTTTVNHLITDQTSVTPKSNCISLLIPGRPVSVCSRYFAKDLRRYPCTYPNQFHGARMRTLRCRSPD